MTSRTRPVRFVDTSLRDGNQSLWGATGITTGICEAVGPALERAGFHAIDFTSSTNLSMGVKFHQEDPWERIARMKAVVSTTPLSAITPGMRFMSWEKSPEAVMRMALRLMARHGVSRLQISEPMNSPEATTRIARWAHEEGFEHVVAALTFTESPVHTDEVYLRNVAAFVADADVDGIYLKDPGGLLTVERTRQLFPKLRDAAGDTTLEIHTHCTTGSAPEVYVVAAQLGADVIHTGLGPLSNGTAQPSIEQLVKNFDALGIPYEIDLDAVAEAGEILHAAARERGLQPGRPTEYDVAPHTHQVPGGMMGTLKRQLSEIGLADALDEVIAEAKRVRAELGYPIMVTPFSQFVGSQSLLNVLAQRNGQERYSQMPDEVLHLVLGHYGDPMGAVAPEVTAKAEGFPRAAELLADPEPVTLDELRARFGGGGDLPEEELILRTVLPHDQVDSMVAARPAPAWHPGGRPVTSLTEFLTVVRDLPNWRSLSVVRGRESIHLKRQEATS